MEKYRIHTVQLHPLQRFVDLLVSRICIQLAADARIHFCGNLERSVQTRQHLAEKPLTVSLVVDIGRIQLIITSIQERSDELLNFRTKNRFAKGHRTENQVYIFHDIAPYYRFLTNSSTFAFSLYAVSNTAALTAVSTPAYSIRPS